MQSYIPGSELKRRTTIPLINTHGLKIYILKNQIWGLKTKNIPLTIEKEIICKIRNSLNCCNASEKTFLTFKKWKKKCIKMRNIALFLRIGFFCLFVFWENYTKCVNYLCCELYPDLFMWQTLNTKYTLIFRLQSRISTNRNKGFGGRLSVSVSADRAWRSER